MLKKTIYVAVVSTLAFGSASFAADAPRGSTNTIIFQTGIQACDHAVMRLNALNADADAAPMEWILSAPNSKASRFRPDVETFKADGTSVYALELPVGDYLIHGLACEIDNKVLITPMERDDPYAQFSVSEKRVHYIGQITVVQRGIGVRLLIEDDYKAVKPQVSQAELGGKKLKRKIAELEPFKSNPPSAADYARENRDLFDFRTDFVVNGRRLVPTF